jgi:hypothetical protein
MSRLSWLQEDSFGEIMADCFYCHKKILKSDLVVSMISSIGNYSKYGKECLAFHYSCFESIAGNEFAQHFHKSRRKAAEELEIIIAGPTTTCAKHHCQTPTEVTRPYCPQHRCTCSRTNRRCGHVNLCNRVRYSPGIPFCARCK